MSVFCSHNATLTNNIYIKEGDSAELLCPASSLIFWWLNGIPLHYNRRTIHHDNIITIKKVTKTDQGIYKCQGKRIDKTLSTQTFILNVVRKFICTFFNVMLCIIYFHCLI